MITVAERKDEEDWLKLRQSVYGFHPEDFHRREMEMWLTDSTKCCWLAREQEEAVGILEASLRNVVDGCLSSPVGYIEGIFVLPDWRARGIARALILTAEDWMRGQGCSEVATDAEIDNEEAMASHLKMGFE